jgi:hypothetical protein
MLFFCQMDSFRNGVEMCMGIDGVSLGLFFDILDAPWAIGRNRSDHQPTSISQNPGTFTQSLCGINNKTQGQSQENSVKCTVRKGQLRRTADLHLNAPALGEDRHLLRRVNTMLYSKRFCKAACPNTNLQPTAGIIISQVAQTEHFFPEDGIPFRRIIPAVICLCDRIKKRSGLVSNHLSLVRCNQDS